MFFFAVAPALASQPKQTYTIGLVGQPVNPGRVISTPNGINHTSKSAGNQIVYGAPWGDGIAQTFKQTINMNTTDYTGQGIAHTEGRYDTGVIEGIINYELGGISPYVYQGPTFTYNTLTVQAGDTFVGILINGKAIKQGTTGELKNIQVRGDLAGVIVFPNIPGLPPFGNPVELWGKNLVYETGVYWQAG
jgi:hypothetical protein